MADFTLDPLPAPPQGAPTFTLDPAPSGGFTLDKPAESPGILSAITQGLGQGFMGAVGDWTKSIQSTYGVKPQTEPATAQTGMKAPFEAALPDAGTLPKLVYHLTEGLARNVPSLGAFVAGSLVGGGPEEPVGLATGAIAAGATSAFQSFGPYWADALKQMPGDPSGAWDMALKKAAADGAINGASFRLFSLMPFKSNVMNLAFQTLGVQPTIGAAGQEVQGAIQGQAPTPGELAQGYVQSALGTALPFVGHKILSAIRPAGGPAGEPPPPPAPEAIPRPQRPPAAPAAPLPPLEPGSVVGVLGPDGLPQRAAIQRIGDGLVHWVGEDNQPRVDDLAAFRKDMTAAPPPMEPVKGNATTVGEPPPPQAGEPPITVPDQWVQQFIGGEKAPALPAEPVARQAALPLEPAKAEVPPAPVPGSLYVNRPVLNAQELHDWAVRTGIPNVVPAEDMHVTQVYSRTPAEIKPLANEVTAQPAKEGIAPLGDQGAVVLHLDSPELQARFGEAKDAGASHDYPEFQPHVTLSYGAEGADLSKVPPPPFPVRLGAEIHTPIDENAPARNQAAAQPEFKLEPPAPEGPTGRAPAAEKPEATLLQFLRKAGLQDEGGELRAMDLQSPKYGVGRNALIRAKGMDWDEAVRAAQEAGYIGHGAGAGEQMGSETAQGDKAQLLDLIRREAGGEKIYPIGREPQAGVDLGREADMREADAMAQERQALIADLASLGETDVYHLDARALKDRLDERLAMTGMDNVADAARAIQAEEATLNRLLASDAAAKAAINTEDTKGEFHGTGQGGVAAGEPAGGPPAGAPAAPVGAAPEVPQAPVGGNQAPGIPAQGGPRAPTVGETAAAKTAYLESRRAAYHEAFAADQQAVKDYRAHLIGDQEFLKARKATNDAKDNLDAAERAATPSVETIPTVEGPREHYVLPGMEQSAVQAQAARDAQRGMTVRAEQKPPNEGLFSPVETNTQQVIPGVSGEATAKAVDPGGVATGLKAAGKTFGQMLLDDSGSVPRREKLLDTASRLTADMDVGKADSLKGISGLAQHTALAQSIAETDPLGARYMAARQDKTAARHSMQYDAQEAGRDYLRAPEAVQSKINKLLEYETMTGRETPNTGRPIVLYADPTAFGERPWPLQMVKPGETVRYTPAETAMIFKMRDFFDRANKQSAQADAQKFGYTGPFLKEGANGRLDFDTQAIQSAIDNAPDKGARLAAERAMGFAQAAAESQRKAYFPLMRYGDWTITVKPKVPKNPLGFPLRDEGWFTKVESRGPFDNLLGIVKGPDLAKTPARVAQEMAKLKQQFPEKDFYIEPHRQDPKTAETVDLPMVNRVLADTKLTDPKTGERLADNVIANLYEEAKAGYRKPREGIPGYSTDFPRAYSDYARQWAGVVAEKLHGDAVRDAYDATQVGPDKRAAKYWAAYHEHNENPQWWGYGAMKRIGFFNYLWGSPSSAMIQMTQTPLITGTQLGLLAGHARAQYMANSLALRALTAVRTNARSGLVLDVKDMPGVTARERGALIQADKEGRLSPVLPTDFAGGQFSPEMRRRFAPAVRVYDMGASAFNTADRANRVASWLSAYRTAQMPGMAEKAARIYANDALYREQVGPQMDPAKFANWFTNETQFLSGREGSSPLMRNAGSVLFQFQHYNTNMLRIMRKNLTKMGPEGKAAFGVMAAGLILGAGLGGLPYVNDAERLTNQTVKWINHGIDPRLDAQFRGWLQDTGFAKMAASFFGTDPMVISEAATEGLSRSALGLDLGRRIGLGNILPGNTDLFTAVPFLDATVGKAMEVWARLGSGQPKGAIAAALPAALANPYKGLGVWPAEGINPQSGSKQYFLPSQVTPQMQAARAFGFAPASVARRQEFMYDQQAIKYGTDAAQKNLVNAVVGNYARSIDASNAGDTANAQAYAAEAERLLRENAARLQDPNIEAWQQIPQPMARALQARIRSYLTPVGGINAKTPILKREEMLNSPYLAQ